MKRFFCILIGISVLLNVNVFAQKYPFQNATLSDDERIDNLLSLMTLDEKIRCLSSDLGIERLGVSRCNHFEGLHGLALGGPGAWGDKRNADGTRQKMELPTTVFPQAYGMGETWDVDLVRRMGDIEAEEIRYYAQYGGENQRNALVMRAPNADLARDPRWGRTEECFGEDAFLAARMTVAMVQGLQGSNPRFWKSASLMKHFLANSNEDGRDSSSSDFDNRLFREYYSYPFYKGITEGGSRAFMASYNSWNGTPMMINPILKSITRDEWGNNGIICTDGGALSLLINAHKTFPTFVEGAAATVKATTGQFLDRYESYIREALEKGLLTEAEINVAIRGNLYVALRLGLLEGDLSQNPYVIIGRDTTDKPWERSAVKDFVREVTAKSVVLLKNKGLLPLDASHIRKIAVIGPRADVVYGDWYGGVPAYEVTILDGIKAMVGENVEVLYAKENQVDAAVKAAQEADVAIVCVGNHPYGTDARWFVSPVPSDGREAVDRKALSLEQEDLVKLVMQANPSTVMVLVSSFPFAINWSNEHVPAILHVTHSSQELGNGVADVLFGKVNPAGRTVQTWVKEITDLPPMMDYDIRHGRTYQYFKGKPLYPFGYGLSYSTFKYSDLNVSSKTLKDSVEVSVNVQNTGLYDGDEVVQLYVSYPKSKEIRPIKQLKGFKRVFIPKGQTQKVKISLKADDLAYWNDVDHVWEIESGPIVLQVGASSTDIRCKITIQTE